MAVLLAWSVTLAGEASNAPFRLSRAADSFFVEDALVYKRLLRFERSGVYHEIDRDRWTSTETDRGTWEQDARGLVLLHPTCPSLRFRALVSGPLTVVLDRPEALDALPMLAEAVRTFLASSDDDVFGHDNASAMQVRPRGFDAPVALLSVDPRAEAFSRADLQALLRQVDDLTWSVRTNTYILQPVRTAGCDLLVLQDAVFQAADLAALRARLHLPAGRPPPFCFARVDARTFGHEAGDYRPFHLPGSR